MRTSRIKSEWIKQFDGTYKFKFNENVYTHNLRSRKAIYTEGRLYSNDGGKTYFRGGGSDVEFNIGERIPETKYIDLGVKQWWE